MITQTFKAKRGARLRDTDAETIGVFLTSRFGDAPVTPQAVVASAKAKRSPIHGYFEWDDRAAADAYRVERAEYLLRSIEVVYANGEERPPTRAWHHVTITAVEEGETPTSGYMPSRVVWETPDYAQQVVASAFRELRSWTDRYREYQQLAGVVSRVDEVIEELAA